MSSLIIYYTDNEQQTNNWLQSQVKFSLILIWYIKEKILQIIRMKQIDPLKLLMCFLTLFLGSKWRLWGDMKNDDLYIPSKIMQVTNSRTELYRKSAQSIASAKQLDSWSAKSGQGNQIRAVGWCEGEGKAKHSFSICPNSLHGSKIYNAVTSLEELGSTKTCWWSKRALKVAIIWPW